MSSSKASKRVNTRIEWIDLYRGMLIFLVCLGHRNSTNNAVLQWLYSFHLPAFFFISGYLIKDKHYINNLYGYLKRIANRLIVPYFLLGIIYIFINVLYCIIFSKPLSLLYWFISLLTTNQFQQANIGPLWFLHSLIYVEIISFFLHKVTNNELGCSIFLAVLGLLFIEYKNSLSFMMIGDSFLLNIPTILIGVFFYNCGHFIKQIQHKWKSFFAYRRNKIVVTVFVVFINLIISIKINDRVDLRYARVGVPILFLIGAFSGIAFLYIIVKCLIHVKFVKNSIEFYGQNTLPVMTFHYFPGFMILETLSYKLLGIVYGRNLLSGKGEGTLYTILVLILLTPLILFFNKYTPMIVGKLNSD